MTGTGEPVPAGTYRALVALDVQGVTLDLSGRTEQAYVDGEGRVSYPPSGYRWTAVSEPYALTAP